MSGCDRMATPLGTLGLSFAICFFFYIAKLYLSYCFFFLVVAMLSLSSFIYLFIYFLSFYFFNMHCFSCLSCIYIGYGSKVFTHHLSHF
jgi:hypothetical protein